MSSSYITTSYHIISHVLLFYLFCWFAVHSIPFYSILLHFKSIRFDSIGFYWIWFTILFSIVSHVNEWFVSICLSGRLSYCLFICMNKFMFSFLFSSLLFFSFPSLFSWTPSSHTHTRTHTHTYIWIYVPSSDSYILLQKPVSEESYSSDCIISYLI